VAGGDATYAIAFDIAISLSIYIGSIG